MVSFLDYEGTDPQSAAQDAAEGITKARREVEARGIKAFLFHADSEEEFDERAAVRGVSDILGEVADSYLGPREEGRAKLTAALRREFTASKDAQRTFVDNEEGFGYTDDDAGREQEYMDNYFEAPEDRELCSECGGSGEADSGESTCPMCGGSGLAHDHPAEQAQKHAEKD